MWSLFVRSTILIQCSLISISPAAESRFFENVTLEIQMVPQSVCTDLWALGGIACHAFRVAQNNRNPENDPRAQKKGIKCFIVCGVIAHIDIFQRTENRMAGAG